MYVIRKVFVSRPVEPKLPTIDMFPNLDTYPLMYLLYDNTLNPISKGIVANQNFTSGDDHYIKDEGTRAIKEINRCNSYEDGVWSFTRMLFNNDDYIGGCLYFKANDSKLYADSASGTINDFECKYGKKYWILSLDGKTYIIDDKKYDIHKLPTLENWFLLSDNLKLGFGKYDLKYQPIYYGLENKTSNIQIDLRDVLIKMNNVSCAVYEGVPTWTLPEMPSQVFDYTNERFVQVGTNAKIVTPLSPDYEEDKGSYINVSNCVNGEFIDFDIGQEITPCKNDTYDFCIHLRFNNAINGDILNCLLENDQEDNTKFNTVIFTNEGRTSLSLGFDGIQNILSNDSTFDAQFEQPFGMGKDLWVRRCLIRDEENNPHIVCYFKTSENGIWHLTSVSADSNKLSLGEGESFRHFVFGKLNNLQSIDCDLMADGTYISLNGNVVWQMFGQESDTRKITFVVTPEDSTITYVKNGNREQLLNGTVLSASVDDVIFYNIERYDYYSHSDEMVVSENETLNISLVSGPRYDQDEWNKDENKYF